VISVNKHATVTDIVALIGDLTDGSVERNRGAAVVLKSIKARIGKYFVSGMCWLYFSLSNFVVFYFLCSIVALSYNYTYMP